ncbi:MAG: DotD/TraH family lipoprotein [Alphaproteobacteria bacterium]|nr:DotD/TraH family lipoprotein [Alphaproteobacteria bacterium]
MIRLLLSLSLFVVLWPLSGCESVKDFSDGAPQVVAAPDSVSAMLAEAADRASTALEALAAVEQARGPGVAAEPVANAPAELRRAVTITWTGPVEPVTKMLAERASYTFLTVGTPPPVPLVVTLDMENRPVIDALRDLGLQMGVRADIRVQSDRKAVEIHYPPNTGVGQEP